MILKLPVVSLLSPEELEVTNVCKLEGGVIFLTSIEDVPNEIEQYPTVVWAVPSKRYISAISKLRKGRHDFIKIGNDVVTINRSQRTYA